LNAVSIQSIPSWLQVQVLLGGQIIERH